MGLVTHGARKRLEARRSKRLAHCYYCGRPKEEAGRLTLDHVIPKDAGGVNAVWNLVLACRHCNRRKGNMSIQEWLALLEREGVSCALPATARLGS